jgi:hypothetical protein
LPSSCCSDLAGIGADEIAQRQIAALDDPQGGTALRDRRHLLVGYLGCRWPSPFLG